MSQNLEQSRKLKQIKEEQDRSFDKIENEKIAKFNYFNGHDQRQA